MSQYISPSKRAYLAGFLDGDGSIYVRLKPNPTYKYGFQVAPYIVLFQSAKSESGFKRVCSLIEYGYLRKRKDGILEYIIGRIPDMIKFLKLVSPYLILKKDQAALMTEILRVKRNIKDKDDFIKMAKLIDRFRKLNYSKKAKNRAITP